MPLDEIDREEETILGTELELALQRRLNKLLDDVPYVTTLLLGIEAWFTANGDPKGQRLVEQLTLKMARHEAETT